MTRQLVIDGYILFIPECWDKFVFRGWVYRVVYGILVRGEEFKALEATNETDV